jgi:hypothetical protein
LIPKVIPKVKKNKNRRLLRADERRLSEMMAMSKKRYQFTQLENSAIMDYKVRQCVSGLTNVISDQRACYRVVSVHIHETELHWDAIVDSFSEELELREVLLTAILILRIPYPSARNIIRLY